MLARKRDEYVHVGIVGFLNKIFGASLLSLYHWQFILKLLISGAGAYLCFRRIMEAKVSRHLERMGFKS